MLSPVNADSSIVPYPLTTTPSTATLSPTLTTNKSPTLISSSFTIISSSSRMTIAVLGDSLIRDCIALVVRPLLIDSSILPKVTNTSIIPVASKYISCKITLAVALSTPIISKSLTTLYTNPAIEPRLTRLSIFGEPLKMALTPFRYIFWLITIIIVVNINCIRAIATGFSTKYSNIGAPHITCPIEIYASGNKNTSDTAKRISNFFVSLSLLSTFALFCPLTVAPYPIFSTARITILVSISPNTCISPVKRFTLQLSTPLRPDTVFSTLALHAPQVIPVTL